MTSTKYIFESVLSRFAGKVVYWRFIYCSFHFHFSLQVKRRGCAFVWEYDSNLLCPYFLFTNTKIRNDKLDTLSIVWRWDHFHSLSFLFNFFHLCVILTLNFVVSSPYSSNFLGLFFFHFSPTLVDFFSSFLFFFSLSLAYFCELYVCRTLLFHDERWVFYGIRILAVLGFRQIFDFLV